MNNDFYIRNLDTIDARYTISPAAAISILINPGGPDQYSVSLTDFLKEYNNPNTFMTSLPFKIVTQNSIILLLEEQYAP